MTTTTAKEMRDKRVAGIEFLLPSYDDVVFIRPMDTAFFFRTGRVPDFLAPTIQKMLIDGSNITQYRDLPQDKLPEFLTWLDDLVKWTVISPKVVDVAQADDEISIDELDYADKLYIYSYFGTPASSLRRFRQQQVNPVEPVDEKPDPVPKAERNPERPAVGE